MWPNPQETADLVTFTEEIINGKLHFLCSVIKLTKICKENQMWNVLYIRVYDVTFDELKTSELCNLWKLIKTPLNIV